MQESMVASKGDVDAGLSPTITAQTAAMMSASMAMDSDSSSSSDEEDPTPVKRHKGLLCLLSLTL